MLLCACRITTPEPWDPSSGQPLPKRVVLPVTGRAQARSLSCESRSAADLLAWYGFRVSEQVFFEGLRRSDNPESGFVGDVDDPGEGLPPAGYGVYEGPVADRLRGLGLDVEASRGRDLAWLRGCVATGRPVIVWATARLDASEPVVLRDGRGASFVAARGEHTFLVVGYDGGSVLLLDPATGTTKETSAVRFAASWSVLGRRAVVPARPRRERTGCRRR